MRPTNRGRRRFLAGLAATGVSALAGCAGGGGDATTGGDEATTTTAADLDSREANVVDVTFERTEDAYRFDVTLSHDDGGEEGYANWWQVETLPGETLGRRKLRHAHGNEPFTRSETVEVPDDVRCVVVRGHDQTHAYGGQVVVVDLRTGERHTVRQGTSKESFVDYDC